MKETYHVWTIQLPRWRVAEQSNIACLDITAKSGIKAFAPSYQDVMLYKEGRLSEIQYTDIYLHRMRDSRRNNPEAWRQLLVEKRVALMCYCPAGCFCHRHLFAGYAKNYLENLGHTVVMHGELLKPLTPAQLTIPEMIQQPREVIGFHGKEDMLSNWNDRGFTIKNVYFPHVECFMMYCKAKLMGDHVTANIILHESDPAECKKLGRKVKPFDEEVWRIKCRPIVRRGLLQKAREHPDVVSYLLSTSGKILAEASVYDKLWGVGLSKSNPLLQDPNQWLGFNWMGDEWMAVRSILEAEVMF